MSAPPVWARLLPFSDEDAAKKWRGYEAFKAALGGSALLPINPTDCFRAMCGFVRNCQGLFGVVHPDKAYCKRPGCDGYYSWHLTLAPQLTLNAAKTEYRLASKTNDERAVGSHPAHIEVNGAEITALPSATHELLRRPLAPLHPLPVRCPICGALNLVDVQSAGVVPASRFSQHRCD